VPILYITHDLGTAYHVSDHILVMYRGNIVEAGDVETVIRSPKHPYTQMLIDSIPWPDPTRRWGQPVERANREIVSEDHVGCPFADRCPRVMERCVESPPPAYLTGPGHAATCYLYADKPELKRGDLGTLIAADQGSAGADGEAGSSDGASNPDRVASA
jgi:peptide/nickel transport system ATP-binding protein